MDEPIVELEPFLRALFDRRIEGVVDVLVDMGANLVELAVPISLQDHPVRRLRAFQEARDVERWICRQKRPNTRACSRKIGKIGRIGRRLRRRSGWCSRSLYPCVGVRGLKDRLLLMAGTLAKHAVQPKADEKRDEREDDDYGQIL